MDSLVLTAYTKIPVGKVPEHLVEVRKDTFSKLRAIQYNDNLSYHLSLDTSHSAAGAPRPSPQPQQDPFSND